MKIFKYHVKVDDKITIEMPKGADVMHFGLQMGEPCVWACVDPENPKEERVFRVIGTGNEMPTDDSLDYIGTLTGHLGQYVWHLFEVI